MAPPAAETGPSSEPPAETTAETRSASRSEAPPAGARTGPVSTAPRLCWATWVSSWASSAWPDAVCGW